MEHGAVEADPDRHGHHNRSGVPDRLHSQPVVGLEYLGLQRAVW